MIGAIFTNRPTMCRVVVAIWS